MTAKRLTTRPCLYCGRISFLKIDAEAYDAWAVQRVNIRDAFPDLTPDQRELIKTGIHPGCWDALFSTED